MRIWQSVKTGGYLSVYISYYINKLCHFYALFPEWMWRDRESTSAYVCLLGNCPTWRANSFSMYLFIYSSLHVSSMSCSSSGETNCTNTASGNCHSVLVAVSYAGWEFTPNQHTTLLQVGQLPRIIAWCTVNKRLNCVCLSVCLSSSTSAETVTSTS